MKTLTKTNLDAMAKLLPELDEDAQRCIVGGTGSCSGVTGCTPTAPTGYTFEQMDSMCIDGSWTGGYVDGYGYYGPVTIVTGSVMAPTGAVEDFTNWCSQLWNNTLDILDHAYDGIVYTASSLGSSIAQGVHYGYLDFKYNGLNAGNGKGNIPMEEYLETKNGYFSASYTLSGGLEMKPLPDNPSYEDVSKIAGTIMGGLSGTMLGFTVINVGNITKYIFTEGAGTIIGGATETILNNTGH